MNPTHPIRLVLAVGPVLAALALPAQAQMTAAERFRAMTDPEGLDSKMLKEKNRLPYEFFRSQVAPFDVLPYVKPGHWITMTVEMRANHGDYDGLLQSALEINGHPQIKLKDMPHAMIYRRDARVAKEQTTALSLQLMLPQIPKELILELTRPDAIRADGGWSASLQKIEPHQMLVAVLSAEPSLYNGWTKYQATLPASGDRDPAAMTRQRYYQFVMPQATDRPALSPQPLTWTTISHAIWDGLSPEVLTGGQKQAMIDWLHWGGQLIVVASGPSFMPLQDSFLGPYLPATLSGQSTPLKSDDLKPLAEAYQPPYWSVLNDDLGNEAQVQDFSRGQPRDRDMPPARYRPPIAIKPEAQKPIYIVGLTPRKDPGVIPLPLGDKGGHLMGVERRVGRGRVLMLAFNPLDPALARWPGMDTLVRRLVLRRPEEARAPDNRAFRSLAGPDLTWVRYLARDLGAVAVEETDPENTRLPTDLAQSNAPVAAWLDTDSALPIECRKALEQASKITIPGSRFVLKVILAYVVALVPLNWLICRYLLRRRELAWVAVPFLALGFAIAVERAAAHDIGFDSACDEIDLVELQPGYYRAHVSRFASLYSTGRERYTIAFPNDPSALALPLNMQHSLRGEEVAQSVFQSSPIPALTDFVVQPRSLSMYRAEALVNLPGGIDLIGDPLKGKIANNTNMDLHDAVLIDVTRGRRTPLGTIAAGAKLDLSATPAQRPATGPAVDWVDLDGFLEPLRSYDWGKPEDQGEYRLVAWAAGPHPGQEIEPAVGRHRGFRLVVAHLRFGPPPDPAGPSYYIPSETRAADDGGTRTTPSG